MKQNIKVTVRTSYITDQSDPKENRYVYAYNICIKNEGTEPAQLVSRYWHITDANERVQEVQGEGVVGEQPVIEPGESYSYTSGVVLETSTGLMTGSYHMRRQNGDEFDAEIPLFSLTQPNSIH